MEFDMNRFKDDEVVQENEGAVQPAGDGETLGAGLGYVDE
jgi:hypothetical protein